MTDFRLAASAESALDEILGWTQENFGEAARERYAALLVAAMQDVAKHPQRSNVSWKRLKTGRIGVYHIIHSKMHAPNPPGAVAKPRHFLVFRLTNDGIVEILGFVHERMLLPRALKRLAEQ